MSRRKVPLSPLNPKDLPIEHVRAWEIATMYAAYPTLCRAAGYDDLEDFVTRKNTEIQLRLQSFERGTAP